MEVNALSVWTQMQLITYEHVSIISTGTLAKDPCLHLLRSTHPYPRRALPFQGNVVAPLNVFASCTLISPYLRGTLVSPEGHNRTTWICKSMQCTLHNGALSISLFYLHVFNGNIRGAYGCGLFIYTTTICLQNNALNITWWIIWYKGDKFNHTIAKNVSLLKVLAFIIIIISSRFNSSVLQLLFRCHCLSTEICIYYLIEAETKWSQFRRRNFQMHFL